MTGLSDLDRLPLTAANARAVRELEATSQGTPAWRARKGVELRELFALSQIAPRLDVLAVDLRTELRALLALRVPVPCRLPGSEELLVAQSARLLVRYPEELLREPLPGYELIQILSPPHVLHPNVSANATELVAPEQAGGEGAEPAVVQRLCLGAHVQRGFPLREMVLQTFSALSLQAITLDRTEPQGVMNPAAVTWWNTRTDLIPLTTEPFLAQPGSPEENPCKSA